MQKQTRRKWLLGVGNAGVGLAAARPDKAERSALTRLPAVEVHAGGHLLQTEGGRPFFWLGDTAWELIDHTTRDECSYYLHTRARQRFTVIQTVVLAESQGITEPSALGLKPFADNDPRKPNRDYFDRVKQVVEEAASYGLYVALVPTWGDKLTAPWGDGPRLFRLNNLADAYSYAHYLADLLKDCTNVIWMLGGDRPARLPGLESESIKKRALDAGFPPDQDWTPIWRELARGLTDGSGRKPVIVYHPQGGSQSSSVFLHGEKWLSVNGIQSGHGGGHDLPIWEWIARDYALTPPKPTLDLEPNYEDHPYNPWPRWNPATGYFRDGDVRKQVYRSVFAGGCGVTYGHHAVWGFVGARNPVINYADRDWIDALQRPAGRQMQFLRDLVESRPFFDRVPDQSLIVGNAGEGPQHLQATCDRQGTYVFVYAPEADRVVKVDRTKLTSGPFRAWWYDPRTGVGTVVDTTFDRGFKSPSYGPDWVLVLDHVAAGYPPPGLARVKHPDALL